MIEFTAYIYHFIDNSRFNIQDWHFINDFIVLVKNGLKTFVRTLFGER